jgi:FkbM family methyltransferase
MPSWRDLALNAPIFKQWRESRQREFTVGDIVLEAPRPPVSRSVRKSLRRNDYEPVEVYLVSRLVRPGNTVLDLGSGLGLTCIAAAKASRGGRVVGYEANPDIAPLAQRNSQKNGVRVEIRNRGIAREKGTYEFHVRRSFTASSVLPTKRAKTILIEADAFRDVVAEIQPQVIACDIEGIEKDVFASTNLSSVQRVIVEVHPEAIGPAGVRKCEQDLAAAGLHAVRPLCFGQIMVFDQDGSSSAIEPFQPNHHVSENRSAG